MKDLNKIETILNQVNSLHLYSENTRQGQIGVKNKTEFKKTPE